MFDRFTLPVNLGDKSESGRGVPDPAFPLLLYPEYGFLSHIRIPFQHFGESRFPSNSQIQYPVKAFWVFQNPALYVSLIPGPENTIPDPKKSGGQCKPAF